MKGRRQRGFIPLGMKLFASYVLLTMVPLALLGWIANSIMVGSVRSQTENNIRGTLRQMEDNVRYRIDDTVRITDMLYQDSMLVRALKSKEEGWANYDATKKVLLPKFWEAINSTDRSMRMSVYIKNEVYNEIYDLSKDGEDILKSNNRSFEILHLSRIQGEGWYKSLPKEQYDVTMKWVQIGDDAKFGRISLIRRIVDTYTPSDLKELGLVRISVYFNDLFDSVDAKKIMPGSRLYIVDEVGKVLHASGMDIDKVQAPAPASGAEEAGRGSLVIREPLPGLQYSLIAVIPEEVLQADARKITWLTVLVCGISMVAIIGVALFVTRAFTKRIGKVISVLQSFRRGDYRRRIQYRGQDEYSMIADALNELGAQTDNLIQEVYLTKLRKKEAELETLQAQINPHFLYNTLSSISRLAKFGEVDKQHQMIMNLARFYRMSLNDGKTIIPAADELDQIQAYLAIQQVKYGDRVAVGYQWDERLLGYMTIKLILQPFVENALEHAWKGDRITISISAELKTGIHPVIEFKVADDGIGMPGGLAEELLRETGRSRQGYGIRNVHERIRLYYGESYGISIETGMGGQGTAIRIRIPARRSLDAPDHPLQERHG
ncbi:MULTISPECIES: sensor histidine kinase [unclassified Paenibacillus]|uniref:sensor histidine kinase n=1 Tax=unclassified Paenibacillus TaxID=185978 RepID=UPI000954268A|nr:MULTISPECIES: sensor histidine kinase [unclassified Paenibacillus]ASS66746.1 sensor histidine kinase [Paenibacillus sp. RUD330]SIP96798.1 Histidine kinase-, DNA gyrase B-, and HSP90-like ATPase [Paenibacillus sp. RU4X]SIQ15405.1 Histidine kinase-, DNA gyrase B-, and HSP90-like ATPase [Paenibacillus sp. RU4T]